MHRSIIVLALGLVFLLAPSAHAADRAGTSTYFSQAKPGKHVKLGKLVAVRRGLKQTSADQFRFYAWAAGNQRCGDWYRQFLAWGNPFYGCVETVIEYDAWVAGWVGTMRLEGVRWTNGGYNAGGPTPWRCRRGYIVVKGSNGAYYVYDWAERPEKCGWGYW
jgi:hypothetical protein